MKIVILAGTLTGNRGSEAMVRACVNILAERYSGVKICVATYYPHDDLAELNSGRFAALDMYIYSCSPFRLLFSWLPASWFIKICSCTKGGSLRHLGGIRDLLDADLVLDVAGVSFIDGREKFLPFNVLSIYPFLLHGIPVIKLSQAVGPFNSFLNRLAARWFLTRVEIVFARGMRTYEMIKNSGLPISCAYAPDVTFCLHSHRDSLYTERPENSVALIPSSLVMSKNSEYIQNLVKLITSLQAKEISVTIIAHSWRDSELPRNNDLIAAEAICDLLENPVPIKGYGMNSLQLREEISRHRLAVSSRFHGMIGALETETPVLVIGWSHKYLEVLEDFGFDEQICFDHRAWAPDRLFDAAMRLLADGAEISSEIGKRLVNVRTASFKQFDEVFTKLEGAESK